MSDFINHFPGTLIYLTISILIVALAVLAQDLIKWLLPRVFPLPVAADEHERVEQLEAHFEREIEALAVAEYLISVASMVLLPYLNYKLLVRVLAVNALAGDRLLFSGGGAFVFASVVGGALLGPFLTRQYIRARYASVPELHWLYERSEDRHGAVGRFLISKSGLLAACIVVFPTVLLANRYTLVGTTRVEIPQAGSWAGRVTLPNEDIVELRVIRSGKSRTCEVLYRDGTLLTSSDSIGSTGDLAAFGKAPREALTYLSEVTGLPVLDSRSPN